MTAVLKLKRPLRPELAKKLGQTGEPAPTPTPPEGKDRSIEQTAARWILATFPEAFPRPPKPLALNIDRQLKAQRPDGVSHNGVNRFLHRWTKDRLYLAALAADGASRHGLDGQVVEPVSDEHRAHARRRLDRGGAA